MSLRPRQLQAIADTRAAFAAGYRAPVLVAPTGMGKSHTAIEIIRSALVRGRRVWFLAHLKEILDDASRRLTESCIAHGHIRAGFKPDPAPRVQVVSVASAARRKVDARPDLIIIDECHLAVAKTYRTVVEAAGNPALLGLTATPRRLDGRGLGELFDCLVLTCGTAELIAEGLLAPIRVFAPPAPDLGELGSRAGDFDQSKAAAILNKPSIIGDALAHWQKLCAGRRGVAFCSTVKHAEAVAQRWNEAGIPAMAVHGDSDDSDRCEAIEGLRAGRIRLVACAQLWLAGVDVPEIDAVVWLRPTQSLTAWLQGCGRGMRTAPGKSDLVILDHVANTHRHGLPTDPREWSLDGKTKRATEAAPAVRTCPECFAALPSLTPECPCCGHVFTAEERRAVQELAGTLTEIAPKGFRPGDAIRKAHGGKVWYVVNPPNQFGEIFVASSKHLANAIHNGRTSMMDDVAWIRADEAVPVADHRAPKPSSDAKTFEELQEVGRRLGYKPGWARRVWAGRMTRVAR